jgi:hypothetical protein
MTTGFSPSHRVRAGFALLLLVMLAFGLADVHTVVAQSPTVADIQMRAMIERELPGDAPLVLAVDQRRTLATGILNADFQDEGVEITVRVVAKNLRGVPIRAAVFFFTSNSRLIAAAEDTPEEFTTADGALTAQIVFKPRYANTKWDGSFFVPYEYFPRFGKKTKAFILAVSGVDGDKFVSQSERVNFTIGPAR